MAIEKITIEKLRTMKDAEGLVIQGCGGDLQEWIDELNKSLDKDGILLDGSKFENAYTFKNDGVTCLFFPFDGVKCDISKMAVWRIKTHSLLCGTWFSDYVDNQLGGIIEEPNQKKKPHCSLVGENGNIYNLMGIASRALRRVGMDDEAEEMCERVKHSENYDKALGVILEYVDTNSDDDESEDISPNLGG